MPIVVKETRLQPMRVEVPVIHEVLKVVRAEVPIYGSKVGSCCCVFAETHRLCL